MDCNGCITVQQLMSPRKYLQISTGCLIELDALKQSFKVASSESLMVVSLDDLNEDCWTILDRFGEDLQKISVVIVVNENFQLLQHRNIFFDLSTEI